MILARMEKGDRYLKFGVKSYGKIYPLPLATAPYLRFLMEHMAIMKGSTIAM